MENTSPPPSKLPQELYDEIVDGLYDHPPSLKSCALTFRSFLVKSQRHLFCNVGLSTDPRHPEVLWHRSGDIFSFADANRFRPILEGSPHLASYILNLRITTNSRDRKQNGANENPDQRSKREKSEQDVTFCLRQLRHLRCLSINTQQSSLIFTNPNFLKVLQEVVALPSLICLDQSSTLESPFKQRSHLQYLSICMDGGRLLSLKDQSPARHQNRCRVEFLRVRQTSSGVPKNFDHYLERSLDIRHLRCLYVTTRSTFSSHSIMRNLLRVCGRNLKELIFYLEDYSDSVVLPVGGLDFSLEELLSLRSLRIRLVAAETNPFLLQLAELLRSLPAGPTNRLEQLFIHANCFRLESTESIIEPWEGLWNLVSDLDYFPCLKKLEFKGFFGMGSEEKVQPNVAAWQSQFGGKRSCSSRLKVRADIMRFEESFGNPYPFWPDDGGNGPWCKVIEPVNPYEVYTILRQPYVGDAF